MEKLTKQFIENPNEESFSLIEASSFALNEVFKHAPNLADQFFKFRHWYLLYRERNNLPSILKKMGDSVESYNDGLKYHYILEYEDRKAHEAELIKLANSVKELSATLLLIGNKYRKEIVEKMRKVAISEEEKKDVSRYEI